MRGIGLKGSDEMTEVTVEQKVTLGSKSGLHARPAAVFVQHAKSFQGQITLVKGEKTANGKSILSVLALGAEQGDEITLKTSGSDAANALSKLVRLLEGDLG
jgi:phosphocarrier protein